MMSLSPMTRTEHTAEKSAFTCAGAFTGKGVSLWLEQKLSKP